MKIFRDNAGREWAVEIHVAAVKRCRDLAGVDLYGLVGDGFAGLAKLVGDPVALVDVLYVLCRDEARARGVSDEDFGRAMAGDAIERASSAFLEELTDFFPDPRVRAGLRRALGLQRGLADRMLAHGDALLDGIDLDGAFAELLSGLKGSSGGAPGSSASTPGPSPSAS